MFKRLNMLFTGIVLGILFAPRKGEDTRKKLMSAFSGYKEEAKDALQKGADNVKSGIDSAKEYIDKA